MAAAATSNAEANAAKRFKKTEQREHVLLRPGMYIGAVEPDRQAMWVLDDGGDRFVKREIDYVPGLYKIFDEILVNALDHATSLRQQTSPPAQHFVKAIKVSIDRASGEISVENDGDGIPVVVHPETKLWVPEMIFGHMLTGSNYDDEKQRIVGGQNGIGAKACNIFSTRFEVETVDARAGKKYKQVFRNNMSVIEPPKITAATAAGKKPYTRITFLPDYARFKSPGGLSDDMRALLLRRCYDVCALTDKDVAVTVDGARLPIKSFERYIDLYLGDEGAERKRAYETLATPLGAWEVAATYTDSASFEQVSFVNGVATSRGGRHVDHLTAQMTARLTELIAKRKKGLDVRPALVKSHLFVFVKALVANPAFDSQSKETLTTAATKFGTGKLELSDKFVDKLAKTGIVERVVELSEAAAVKDLKKLDGKLRSRITGIPKLEDANWAGGPKRGQCTLILTEGDSAKSMAIAGLSVVGRDRYGVFPLKGKVLNVKDVPLRKLMENDEINHLKTILGLESGKTYAAGPGDLRYGRIMIMTDQDVDGSHIKGLLFNLFETLWPALLRAPGFLTSMLTPIIKVSTAPPRAFYTLQDYDAWKRAATGPAARASVKYYKGLGTSTAAEAKEYFRDMKLVTYGCDDPGCKEALDLAFNKKRAHDRKAWLEAYDKGAILRYGATTQVAFSDFVHRDLIHFSKYDLERSIPHVQDGLKVSQRKIMYTCFGRSFAKEVKVFMLAADVARDARYHHGDASLYTTIVGLAQDFVGANNVNLLEPIGQFGTRLQGGADAASARYINTRPSAIVELIFRPEDRPILTYLEDDGEKVEPEFYVPIVPMVLVNGAAGIGTGFSTNVPSFDPLQVVRALKAGDMAAFDDLLPWYRGFKGRIEAAAPRKRGAAANASDANANADDGGGAGKRYTSFGVYERTGPKTVRLRELPVGVWIDDYKAHLEARIAAPGSALAKYDTHCTDTEVDFVLTFASEDALTAALGSRDFVDELKLAVTSNALSTTNMHLFNAASQIKRYDTVRAIVEDFARVRLEYYGKRRAYLLAKLRDENAVLENKRRFIEMFVAGTVVVHGRGIDAVSADLAAKGFLKVEDSYDYLLRLPISSLTLERKAKLEGEIAANRGQIDYYASTTDRQLWVKELGELEAALLKMRGKE